MPKNPMLKHEGEGTERHDQILANIIGKFPIELAPKIPTLDKPLIINCAYPGWQPRMWPRKELYRGNLPHNYEEGGVRYPAVPQTIEQQVADLVEAAKAGCASVHVHPRDPMDSFASESLKLVKEVYDRVFEQTDVISLQHTWKRTDSGDIDYIEDTEELLKLGNGNKYCQAGLVLWPTADSYTKNYDEDARNGVLYMQEHKVKPIIKIRSHYHLKRMKRALIDTKVLNTEPLVIIHDVGHPFGWPMDVDPWMPIELISTIMHTKAEFPDALTGVFVGYRNWMPITMTAILAGVDMVQIGIEDCYWMYPHKDEVIQRNIDAVSKITTFCELIGREIATVDKARKILGVVRT